MALLFVDGFSGGDAGVKWTAITSPGPSRSTSGPRLAGRAFLTFNNGGTQGAIRKSFTASSEVYLGFGFRPVSGPMVVTFLGDADTTSHLVFSYSTTTHFFRYRAAAPRSALAPHPSCWAPGTT